MSAINSSTIDNVSLSINQGAVINTKISSQEIDTNERNTNQSVLPQSISEIKAEEASSDTRQSSAASTTQLEKVAQQLQDFVGEMNKGLEFLVDKDSGRDVIKVIDKSNGDLIKQYPSEEVLSLVAKLSEAAGSFVNEKI